MDRKELWVSYGKTTMHKRWTGQDGKGNRKDE
jgi:hypothetical protein